MKKVIVVIPAYKREMTCIEEISYLQCQSILGKYPICLVVPESLDVKNYIEKGNAEVYRFPDKYFKDVEAYGSLCMEKSFYKRFSEYEYMLIYQLDAFVFSDRLLYFCELGYDYIGAPCPPTCWCGLPFNVGNGGLSLRKISSFIEITGNINYILNQFYYEFNDQFDDNIYKLEDCFFSYCGYKKDLSFCTPSIEKAFEFSIEFNINGIYEKLDEGLPSGCHRWDTYRFEKWWSIIQSYGYKLPEAIIRKQSNEYQWHEYRVLMSYIEKNYFLEKIGDIIIKTCGSQDISVWGLGQEGNKIITDLLKMKLNIQCYFDSKKSEQFKSLIPQIDIIFESKPIIVTSTKYDIEISNTLKAWGLQKDMDYFLWKDIVKKICKEIDIIKYGEIV